MLYKEDPNYIIRVAKLKRYLKEILNDKLYVYTSFLKELEQQGHHQVHVWGALIEFEQEGFVVLKFDNYRKDYVFRIDPLFEHKKEIDYEDLEVEEPPQIEPSNRFCSIL